MSPTAFVAENKLLNIPLPVSTAKHKLGMGIQVSLLSETHDLVPILLCYSRWNGPLGSLYWLASTGPPQLLPLHKLVECIGGKGAAPFANYEMKHGLVLDEFKCLSLISSEISLHLVATSLQQREEWVVSLHTIMTGVASDPISGQKRQSLRSVVSPLNNVSVRECLVWLPKSVFRLFSFSC